MKQAFKGESLHAYCTLLLLYSVQHWKLQQHVPQPYTLPKLCTYTCGQYKHVNQTCFGQQDLLMWLYMWAIWTHKVLNTQNPSNLNTISIHCSFYLICGLIVYHACYSYRKAMMKSNNKIWITASNYCNSARFNF